MGKLIVIDGLDGSGKTTKSKLLYEELKNQGKNVRLISFPNYESEEATLVKMYLRGDFGDTPDAVNGYAAATFFSVERYASFKELGGFLSRGGFHSHSVQIYHGECRASACENGQRPLG